MTKFETLIIELLRENLRLSAGSEKSRTQIYVCGYKSDVQPSEYDETVKPRAWNVIYRTLGSPTIKHTDYDEIRHETWVFGDETIDIGDEALASTVDIRKMT